MPSEQQAGAEDEPEQQRHVTGPRRWSVDQQALHRLGRVVGLGTRHRGSHGARGRLRKGVCPVSKKTISRRPALAENRPFGKLRRARLRANVFSGWSSTLNLRCPYHDVRASRQQEYDDVYDARRG